MIRNIKDSPLHKIVNPKSVAFFGASNRFTSMGSNQLNSLLSLGFEGNIYPVHPKESKVQGLAAYQSVLDLPEIPDVAVMVLPTGVVPGALEACGQKGIKGAVIVSGGFKEVGREGALLEAKIVETANLYGMRFLGPNCLGVANPHHNYNTTFLPFVGRPGFIGMASQSGSFITQMFDYLAEFGISFSAGISVGNEADIDIIEAMEYLAACPNTKVIALYVEAIRRGSAFIKAARKIVPHKPIVALYVGGSEAGKRAGFSHTGALAGPDKLYDGVFRQSGVVRANSITELFDFCWVLGTSKAPDGNQVIVQTSAQTLKKLEPYVPHTGSANNPVDLTFTKNPLEYYDNIPRILLEEPGADMLMVYFMAPKETIKRGMLSMGVADDQIPAMRDKLFDDQAGAMAALRKKYDKPIIGFSFHNRRNPMLQKLQAHLLPALPSPNRAARAMAALVEYAGFREEIMEA
jgi:acyl-CoA synthetase (NDP forming)